MQEINNHRLPCLFAIARVANWFSLKCHEFTNLICEFVASLYFKTLTIKMNIEELVGKFQITGSNQDAENHTYKGTLTLRLDRNKRIKA